MTIDLILAIIDKSLALALLTEQSMSDEQRKAFLQRHDERMQVLHGLLAKCVGPSA